MFTIQINPVAITTLVGTLLTIFFAYFPKVRVWYALLEVEKASLLKLGLMLLTEVVVVLLSLYRVIPTEPQFVYDASFWFNVIVMAGTLILTNQPVQSILPNARDVRIAIQKRLRRESLFIK